MGIKLVDIIIRHNVIEYKYNIDDALKTYFFDKELIIEYPESIESVPAAVLAVPFVANVLPIVWLTDSELIIDELDSSFYNCIPNLKKGYETMFPESTFGGTITVNRIVNCDRPSKPGRCAMFYSGGLDSVHTFVTHFNERPDLLSIWGSDIKYENREGWDIVHQNIAITAEHYDLPDVVIHSSFREFDNEGELDKAFSKQLKDGWWHGVKHGIALLGHVAPYAYLHNISTMYIASSHCPQDGPVRCASNPLTDNTVRFCDCQVVHDGFEYNRQEKMHNIVRFCNDRNIVFPLHVCWESQKGTNCCQCEKCYRTMAGLIAENADLRSFGFNNYDRHIGNMHDTIVREKELAVIWNQWPHIQKAFKSNRKIIKKTPYWKDVKWILTADFIHPETLQLSLGERVKKAKGIRAKLSQFKSYQLLHNIKEKLK